MKARLRKEMLAKRRNLGAEELVLACGYVCDQLGGLSLPQGAVVAGYSSINNEVDIMRFLEGLHFQGFPVALPTVSESERILSFVRWTPQSAMSLGKHKIMEPVGADPIIPQILCVPLLAFDRAGHRLGYGAGHYDATIEALKPELTIGIAYSFQEVDKLPAEAHDRKLDMIVTDKEIIRP